jgi:flavorubredoxin
MRQIKPKIYEVGAIDFDRRLFDQLIPLPDGTSYNAYLVIGSKKTALLDTVDPTKTEVLIDNLIKAGVTKIDYIISHHAEQDHSGSIPDVLTIYPDAKVITGVKGKQMLIDLLCIEAERIETVEDNQCISLGDKTLQFVNIPWVHWPETIGTYLKEDKILFSCDFFGSHLAATNLYADDWPTVYESAKRYYAEIMMPFREIIKKNIAKISTLDIEIIAPSHGPVYNKPGLIVDAYKDWISDKVKNEVVIAYVSMHKSTGKMVEYFVDALMDKGVTVKQFDLVGSDIGKLAVSLVDAATIVIATPTVLAGAHPLAAYAAVLANALRPKTKFASIIGSYGWGGKMVNQLSSLLGNLKAEIIEPVLVKGYPKDEDFSAIDKLAETIARKHVEIGAK